MMNSMKLWAIQSLITALMTQLDSEAIRRFVGAGLDALEDMVEKSDTKLDDQIALPLITQIRVAFTLPE